MFRNVTKIIKPGLFTLLGLGVGVSLEKYRRDDKYIKFGQNWNVFAGGNKAVQPWTQLPTSSSSAPSFPTNSEDEQLFERSNPRYIPFKDSETDERVALISKHGFPSLQVEIYENFVLSYNTERRIANWVLEYINRNQLIGDKIDRRGTDFVEDPTIYGPHRATNADYERKVNEKGYDRGHLATPGNHKYDPKLAQNTFVLTNICPQVGIGFNQGIWSLLEENCRKKVKQEFDDLWVCTGTLFIPQRCPTDGKLYVKYEVIGENHVAVPTHFFKVLVGHKGGKYHLLSYVIPNKAIEKGDKISNYLQNIDAIERTSGLRFFPKIDRNQFTTINGIKSEEYFI